MKTEIISCDVCGKTGAKICYFYVDRRMDPAGSMEDQHESMDLCDTHQWAAYEIAEKKSGTELGKHVHAELLRRAAALKKKKANGD